MKVKDIERIQALTEGEKLYLVQQGLFWHAYGEAAEYLAPITGYKIRERYRPDGTTYKLLGFPVNTLTHVIQLCSEADEKVVFEVNKTLVKITFEED